MPVIEIPIPEEMDKALTALASDKNDFIIAGIKRKLSETKFESLKDELIEGYSSSHAENLVLTNDYRKADLENWDEY